MRENFKQAKPWPNPTIRPCEASQGCSYAQVFLIEPCWLAEPSKIGNLCAMLQTKVWLWVYVYVPETMDITHRDCHIQSSSLSKTTAFLRWVACFLGGESSSESNPLRL